MVVSSRRRGLWAALDRDATGIVVTLLGTAFLIGGLVMLFVPGPGMVATAIGLALLSTQFAWAKRLLGRAEATASAAVAKITTDRKARVLLAASGTAMLLGGIVVAVAVPTWRVVGIFVGIAGLISCVMLLPPVQTWMRGELAETDTDRSDPNQDQRPSKGSAHPPSGAEE